MAVVLSAQSTDKGVNKATAALFAVADTPQKMVALGVAGVEGYIRQLGLYRTKAKNVVALSEALVNHHGSAVPNDQAALEALPGVGRKTANVVRAELWGEPTLAVDTHVFRVSRRLGLARGITVQAVEDELLAVVPLHQRPAAHHWLILHGRYVCTARAPQCGTCPLAALCPQMGVNVKTV